MDEREIQEWNRIWAKGLSAGPGPGDRDSAMSFSFFGNEYMHFPKKDKDNVFASTCN